MNKQTVPFFSLSKQTENIANDINTAVSAVINSQQFINGSFVEKFETEMAKYLGAKHVIGCNSGTDALWLALKALGVKKDTIVLTTPFSFIASASEIAPHGGHVAFIDIEPQTLNIDPKKLEAWLQANATFKNGVATHKVTGFEIGGLVVVDIFGQCADYKQLRGIADEWGLWIIEDACQAIAAEVDGVKAGNFGDIAAFSFYPTKNLGAFGDAGCCSTNNPELAAKILRLRNHGRATHYDYVEHGINSRLDGMQAAILTAKLAHLDKWTERRREIASLYNTQFANLSFIKRPLQVNGKHVYHQYTVLAIDQFGGIQRDELKTFLADRGVNTCIYYPKGLDHIEFLSSCPALKNHCPVSDRVIQSVLSLPVFPELENEQVLYICEQVKEFIPVMKQQQVGAKKLTV